MQEKELHLKLTAVGQAVLFSRDAYKKATGKDPEKDDGLTAASTTLPDGSTAQMYKATAGVGK